MTESYELEMKLREEVHRLRLELAVSQLRIAELEDQLARKRKDSIKIYDSLEEV